MKFALVILLYALIGSCVFVWTTYNETINPIIAFGFFITYAILGGIFFRKLGDRGFLI